MENSDSQPEEKKVDDFSEPKELIDHVLHEAELRHKQIENLVHKEFPEETEKTHEEYTADKPFITDYDLHLFASGTHYKIYEKLGAQTLTFDGMDGVHFAVWAPNAMDVSVVGDFNEWNEDVHHMKKLNDGGIWTLFIPHIREGHKYKYCIRSNVHDHLLRKADPFAFYSEVRPKNASVVHNINRYEWKDNEWVEKREIPWNKPMSVYEVHLGSWKRDYHNIDFQNEWGFLNYKQLAYELVDYVKKMGYTHIELLPVMEHPLDISWGYQVTCYYAPTSRYGTPEDFMFFVDYCHQNGIGVILDWVPAHFPSDEFSLAFFDGHQIFAYESWKKGIHKEWGTYVFDYGKNEVINYLIASALFWMEKYHIDGLRVDAVASMLYLDYSREHGEWEPNVHGGRENLEAINFIKHLNDIVSKNHPGVMMIAEESTAWPGVTHSVRDGGLGFSMKWNMGWMNDILLYFSKDPIHRKFHQGKITFSLWYAFTENFVLPISHDEIVHGKKSLLEKMPGDVWQKFANLRTFIGFMYAHPGKKLNFMTNDLALDKEWNCDIGLETGILSQELNKKFNLYFADVNKLYSESKAMYEVDFSHDGFQWVDFSDAVNSVLSFIRKSAGNKEMLLFVFNMTPITRENYKLGVPKAGNWKEILNSDASEYGGSGIGNIGARKSNKEQFKEWENSIEITLPPLSMLVFKWEK